MNESELKKELESIEGELEDIKENLKYMLDFSELEDINILNIHYQINKLIGQKEAIKDQLFNLKVYDN